LSQFLPLYHYSYPKNITTLFDILKKSVVEDLCTFQVFHQKNYPNNLAKKAIKQINSSIADANKAIATKN